MVGHLCCARLLDSTGCRPRLRAHDCHDALWFRMSWDCHVSCRRFWCQLWNLTRNRRGNLIGGCGWDKRWCRCSAAGLRNTAGHCDRNLVWCCSRDERWHSSLTRRLRWDQTRNRDWYLVWCCGGHKWRHRCWAGGLRRNLARDSYRNLIGSCSRNLRRHRGGTSSQWRNLIWNSCRNPVWCRVWCQRRS